MSIAENLDQVLLRVNEGKSRRSRGIDEDVCLVAVSKTKPKEAVMEAYSFGCRHFGENYVNELFEKASDPEILEMCPDINWHFIGHLQSNKVNKVIGTPRLYMIQTIDSIKLADQVNKSWEKANKTGQLKVMVQINTSEEESKSGISIDDAHTVVGHIIQKCPHLHCVGIMTIGSANYDIKLGPNPEYQALAKCRDSLCERFNLKEMELSMGMSDDFVHAIELGSSCVRVGRCIFGERAKKQNA